jgi:hypothetical protein
MLDDLTRSPGVGAQRDGARPAGPAPTMADREIPIVSATPFDAMHRWLDGEASETAAAQDAESARYVALWRRVGDEASRRRADRPSADFASRVMAALPGGAVPLRADLALVSGPAAAPVVAAPTVASSAAQAAPTPWWHGSLELNRGTALAAATGLVAVGLLLGAAFRGQ